MARQPIPASELRVCPVHLWGEQWLLLTAGDFASGRFNAMTVGWGSLGMMWGRPFAQIVVRPQRHTREFLDEFPTFTLTAFAARWREALQLLGSRSGRDGDKIKASGLTPCAATKVAAPAFAEAELVIECRKIYWQDITPEHFVDPAIASNYPKKDYHRVYFGEIEAVTGEAAYRR